MLSRFPGFPLRCRSSRYAIRVTAMLARQFAPITPKIPEYDTDVFRIYRDQAYPLASRTVDINTAFRTAAEQAEKVIQEKSNK